MRIVAVLFAVLVGACFSDAHQARVSLTMNSKDWTCAGPPEVKCPGKPKCTGWDETWLATCEADTRIYSCNYSNKGTNFVEKVAGVECSETERSKARVRVDVVVDRLRLETGCNAIRIVSQSQWKSGSEQAYRMEACGSFYVCTSAAGRTDCKAAASPPSATPAK